MVGAVGIENNANRNFKDLEEMRGNAKALKRNNRACKGILIGPPMAPGISRNRDSVTLFVGSDVGSGPNLRHGWQADECNLQGQSSRDKFERVFPKSLN